MTKKLFTVLLLMAVTLAACGGQTATEAPAPPSETFVSVPTEAPATESPIATETSAAPATQPDSTPTSGTPVPTNAPDCTNSASFVADVTIPDNTAVGAGTIFTKTWRVRNTGTCIWGPEYTLTYYSDERMNAPAAVPLGVTFPGETLDISVDLTAPNGLGTRRGNFVIKNPAGLIMKIDNDSRLWLIINVTNPSAPTATAIPTTGTPGSPAPGTGNSPGFAKVTCAFTTDSAKVTDVINAVNAYRTQNNLPVYTVNEKLTLAAQAHANDMACNNLFVHTGSDGSTPQTRVATSGYIASSATENVYGSYPPLTGQGAVNWWINDKTDLRHNQNLLSNTYVDIGVGYSFFNNYGFYVLVFAKP
jgi:uncharacterized protein YkwD